MGKVIAVTSGKGGTGKSTFCVGLALSLSRLGKKVLLIDLDAGLRCLDLMLGIDAELVFDLSDAIGGRPLSDAVYRCPSDENISLIPAPAEPDSLTAASLAPLLSRVLGDCDYLLLDFPAGIDFSLFEALPQQTQIIAVCCPDPVSVRDAAVVCARLPKLKRAPVFVLNRFLCEDVRSGAAAGIDDAIDRSGFRLLGIIPESRELALFASSHRLKRNGRSQKAFDRIARRLDGQHVRLPAPKKI